MLSPLLTRWNWFSREINQFGFRPRNWNLWSFIKDVIVLCLLEYHRESWINLSISTISRILCCILGLLCGITPIQELRSCWRWDPNSEMLYWRSRGRSAPFCSATRMMNMVLVILGREVNNDDWVAEDLKIEELGNTYDKAQIQVSTRTVCGNISSVIPIHSFQEPTHLAEWSQIQDMVAASFQTPSCRIYRFRRMWNISMLENDLHVRPVYNAFAC
jgi:hypothetical protein